MKYLQIQSVSINTAATNLMIIQIHLIFYKHGHQHKWEINKASVIMVCFVFCLIFFILTKSFIWLNTAYLSVPTIKTITRVSARSKRLILLKVLKIFVGPNF